MVAPDNSSKRNGVGCPPPAEEPEVLPVYESAAPGGQLSVGRVCFDRATTLQSPFFWLLLGAGGAALITYLILREKNR